MNIDRHGLAAAVSGTTAFVMGGIFDQQGDTTDAVESLSHRLH
jgi:Trm5-related predicted tRNA methylase